MWSKNYMQHDLCRRGNSTNSCRCFTLTEFTARDKRPIQCPQGISSSMVCFENKQMFSQVLRTRGGPCDFLLQQTPLCGPFFTPIDHLAIYTCLWDTEKKDLACRIKSNSYLFHQNQFSGAIFSLSSHFKSQGVLPRLSWSSSSHFLDPCRKPAHIWLAVFVRLTR